MGKVLLAFLSWDETRRLLEKAGGLVARTPKTITTWEALARDLAIVRERGHAFDDEEAVVGGFCVAAPVRDRSGEVVASISVSGMNWEIDRSKLDDLTSLVFSQAEALSFKLGYAFSTEW